MEELSKLVGLTITAIDLQKGAEDGTGFVYLDAVGADETPDIDGEIFDYKTSKPLVAEWSEDAADSTKAAGQAVSYGNVRAQHGAAGAQNAAGNICEPIVYDDKKRRISLRVKVVDKDAITKVREGVYRGMSVKGALVGKKWRDGDYYRYTVKPTEFSLVDKPANPSATITVIKADGAREVVQMIQEIEKSAKTKRVGGKDLTASQFAYVGDPDKTDTWKLPIHDASHVRNALARLNQTQGIPSDKMAGVKRKIMRAAKRFGIDAKSLDEKETGKSAGSPGWAGTGMGQLAQLAYLLDQLFYLRDTTLFEAEIEGDESEIPDRLAELLETAGEILRDMTSEEVEEMIAMTETNKAATAEEIAKEAKSHREKAKAAHDEMDSHIAGKCSCKSASDCEEKVADLHKKVKEHMKAAREADDEAEKASRKGETEEEKKAREKKEAEEKAHKEAADKGDKEKAALVDEIKTLKGEISELRDIVTKAAEGKGFERPKPVVNGKVVTKADDGGEAEKDLVDKKAALDPKDPHYVDKVHALETAAEPELVKI